MPPAVSRQTFQQALTLFGKVARRTAFAGGIGALFCYTEATVEQVRGKHDMTSGLIAGAVAGLAFGGFKPMPQPIVWPLTFALAAASADIVAEVIPRGMEGFRYVVGDTYSVVASVTGNIHDHTDTLKMCI